MGLLPILWIVSSRIQVLESLQQAAVQELLSLFDIVFVTVFRQILNFFFAKIECGLYLLDPFGVLISKMIFKK
jgi:hypothetical protein